MEQILIEQCQKIRDQLERADKAKSPLERLIILTEE